MSVVRQRELEKLEQETAREQREKGTSTEREDRGEIGKR
jgi:hypothetical protein